MILLYLCYIYAIFMLYLCYIYAIFMLYLCYIYVIFIEEDFYRLCYEYWEFIVPSIDLDFICRFHMH